MLVAVLVAELRFHDARSLKDKRQRLSGILGRIRSRFPVSATETAFHDLWQRARIGVALAATDERLARAVLDRVAGEIGGDGETELVESRIEIIDVEEGPT